MVDGRRGAVPPSFSLPPSAGDGEPEKGGAKDRRGRISTTSIQREVLCIAEARVRGGTWRAQPGVGGAPPSAAVTPCSREGLRSPTARRPRE